MEQCAIWSGCVGVSWVPGRYGLGGPTAGSACYFKDVMSGDGEVQTFEVDSAPIVTIETQVTTATAPTTITVVSTATLEIVTSQTATGLGITTDTGAISTSLETTINHTTSTISTARMSGTNFTPTAQIGSSASTVGLQSQMSVSASTSVFRGAIGGIVGGILGGMILSGLAVFLYFKNRNRTTPPTESREQGNTKYETAMNTDMREIPTLRYMEQDNGARLGG